MNVNKEALQIKKELPKTLIISSFIAIVFVLSLLPFIAWLLEYKDTISAPLTITTKTTPIDIYTKVPGELILLVKNNTFVEEGTPLAIIRNTTDHSKLKEIQQVLSQENLSNLDKVEALKKSESTELGELKPLLVAALKASEDYKTFLKTDQHQTLIQSLTDQIGLYESRALIFQKRSGFIAKDKMYTEKIAEVDQGLFKEDVIAARELDRSNQAKISKEIDVLENETRINSLAIEIETLKQESIGIKSKFDATKLQLENAIKDQLQLLNNGIATWELTYLLKASIDGTCIYKEYLNDYRFVEKEEKVFSLIAQEENQYFALLKLPMQGAGKVQLNQEVYVKLNNYPFMEFGVIKGFITDIAAIPFEANYNVQVNFPNGFISTYGDTLATTPLMLGIGEIIVEKKSLYNRIADQIKSVRLNR